MKRVLVLILLLLPCTNLMAAQKPKEGKVDPRVKTVNYRESEVYVIHTHYLQETLVQFNRDEEIVHVGTGDPEAWQMVAIGNYLSLKPHASDADTNLNILTKHIDTEEIRSYTFELNAGETRGVHHRSGTFMMKFRYPEDELKAQMAKLKRQSKKSNPEVVTQRKVSAEQWNMEYSFAGDTSLVPVRTFDDGEFTYFQFPKRMDTPAIFLVDENKKESLINFHVKGKYMVVQKIGKQFILRNGDKATCIFNDAYDGRGEGTVLKPKDASVANNDSPSFTVAEHKAHTQMKSLGQAVN